MRTESSLCRILCIFALKWDRIQIFLADLLRSGQQLPETKV